MRISGITLPDDKQLAYTLPLIYGIGPMRAREILAKAGVALDRTGKDLSAEEEQQIRSIAESYLIEGELRREVGQNIRRLKDIRSTRGLRHERRLPARGGRTRTNSRTVRGNVRRTMGSGKRTLEKT
ncbi:MAG: 30S ribosomal protein S13 [Parcubacteria group bacterium 21-54-25]|nr:MAG: 30S ribosomal protein S13 [Parcubacteria group bacterium 21-54-25]HQU07823.1 30S ribosomal protein S13 [Candidatus Paceibacterota bacterium]